MSHSRVIVVGGGSPISHWIFKCVSAYEAFFPFSCLDHVFCDVALILLVILLNIVLFFSYVPDGHCQT